MTRSTDVVIVDRLGDKVPTDGLEALYLERNTILADIKEIDAALCAGVPWDRRPRLVGQKEMLMKRYRAVKAEVLALQGGVVRALGAARDELIRVKSLGACIDESVLELISTIMAEVNKDRKTRPSTKEKREQRKRQLHKATGDQRAHIEHHLYGHKNK